MAPRRILVVDNVSELCDLLADAFSEAGFAVATACDAAAARRLLATESFELMLIDAVLPGESGESLAAHAERLAVKIILMSGNLDILSRKELPWPHLAKPFRLSRAIELVRDLLGRPSN